MDTAEIRKQTKEDLKGKHLKASMIFLLYSVFTAICCLIPIVGGLFIMVMSAPLAYGVIVSMIKLKKDEEVGYVDFVKISFSEFSNAWRVLFSTLAKVWPYLVGYFISMIFIVISVVTGAVTFGLGMSGSTDAAVGAGGATLIFMILGGIGVTVFAILLMLKYLYYSLVNYVLYDNSELKGKEIVEKSYDLMNGHRWHFVKMQIPYYLIYWLACLILGIIVGIFGIESDSPLVSFLSLVPLFYFMPLIQFSILNFYDKLKGGNE